MADETGWLQAVLAKLRNVRAAVIGDFCVDAYWHLDAESASPISIETGLPVRCVRRQSCTLGGAGNVVANLIDLGVQDVRAIGMVGDDPWGAELVRLLKTRGADVTGMIPGGGQWQTTVYAKPHLGETEENRIDFGAFNKVSESAGNALIAALEAAAAKSNVVIINQQFQNGLADAAFVAKLNRVIADHPLIRFFVDSRDAAALFKGAVWKLNTTEAAKLVGKSGDASGNGAIASEATASEAIASEATGNESPGSGIEAVRAHAQALAVQSGQPVFITRGDRGIVVADRKAVTEIPGIQIIERTDPVCAGDTVIAAVAAVLGSGADAVTAAKLANIAASITVKKLRTTGTATPAEILAAGASIDYVYAPDLADNPRAARYVSGTEIEIVHDLPSDIRIRHAIFDHDGTLSTLREGWEKIMEPMAVRAVLGARYNDVSPKLFEKVSKTVREFIDKTTGIQTLVQMAGLARLVRQFGLVPEAEILDVHGYKAVYNHQLLEMVRQRIAKLDRGELQPGDFQIKNAHLLLRRLHEKGVKLYLASGTDVADVISEAAAMGYADLFEGRIYGAVGNVNVEAKKVVLDRIIRDNKLAGHEIVSFGDGPVEMRETRKQGGICVGICSDEVRRFGFNPSKRSRLIRGGAGLLVADFSQIDHLLALLKLA
jgi:rfaE bifunctional protein kinase chain/domain